MNIQSRSNGTRAKKVVAQNRKAYHDYFIQDVYEAGIELFGTEVKSIRQGKVNLRDSYVSSRRGEMFILGMHVSPYEKGNIFNKDPLRERRLLLHRREINKMHAAIKQKGLTLVPTSLYFIGPYVKVEIALAKGKKLYDKRDADAKRTALRALSREVDR